jgi:hypothetical protein
MIRLARAALITFAFAFAFALVACGAEPPAYVPPPKLPPCPRQIGSVYHPGNAAEATRPNATPAAPAAPAATPDDSKEIVAVAMGGTTMTAAHPRQAFKPVPRPAPAPGAVASCGDKKNPCPLQRWMREKVSTAVAANDAPALAAALDRMAKFSPSPAWQWNAMSATAADAARRGDMVEARKSCQGCHNAYKAQYREKFRTRPVP